MKKQSEKLKLRDILENIQFRILAISMPWKKEKGE
jgi:hypothetical protein